MTNPGVYGGNLRSTHAQFLGFMEQVAVYNISNPNFAPVGRPGMRINSTAQYDSIQAFL